MENKIATGILCLIFLINKEYSTHQKGFIKERIFHFIATMFVVVMHSDSVTGVINLLTHYHRIYYSYTDNLSGFGGTIFFTNHLITVALGGFLLLCGIGLIYRDERVRKIIVNFILVFIPLTSISVYMLEKQKGNENASLYLLVALIISTLCYGSVSYLYRRKFMINFFQKMNLSFPKSV
jgi:hypothetical protein